MRKTLTRWLWWIAFVASVILMLAAIPGYELQLKEMELSSGFATIQQVAMWLVMLLSLGSAVLCLALALLVFLKRSGEPMALFLSFFLLIYGIVLVGPLELFLGYWVPQSSELAIPLQTVLLTILWTWLILIFPNGRFYPRWTRWLIVAAFLLSIWELLSFTSYEWLHMTTTRAQVSIVINGTVFLLAMGIQFYRYRKVYGLTERQQTKWVLIGLVGMFILLTIVSIPYYYIMNLSPGTPQPWWASLSNAGWNFSLILLPASLTIAILRYRLFDIDVIIRRTLVYGTLTISLALAYFSSVLLLQRLFQIITGQHQSPIITVISTLGIAALFTPLRRWMQDFIDWRFYRRKYDAQKTLETFAARVRDEVELEQLTAFLLAVVQETMQPERVSLWMAKPERTHSDSSV